MNMPTNVIILFTNVQNLHVKTKQSHIAQNASIWSQKLMIVGADTMQNACQIHVLQLNHQHVTLAKKFNLSMMNVDVNIKFASQNHAQHLHQLIVPNVKFQKQLKQETVVAKAQYV